MARGDPNYRFAGFQVPRYTPTPDVFFDEVAPHLNEAELRVALYVIRRTFGFKKDEDAISLNQLEKGIVKRDGTRLDYGTGMSRTACWRGASGLVEKGILTIERRLSDDGGNEVNIYRLHFANGVGAESYYPVPLAERGVGVNDTPQETVVKTQSQETGKSSSRRTPTEQEKRNEVAPWVADFHREFRDEAPYDALLTTVAGLYAASGLSLQEFVACMYQAREKVKARPKLEKRAAYWITCLKKLVKGEG